MKSATSLIIATEVAREPQAIFWTSARPPCTVPSSPSCSSYSKFLKKGSVLMSPLTVEKLTKTPSNFVSAAIYHASPFNRTVLHRYHWFEGVLGHILLFVPIFFNSSRCSTPAVSQHLPLTSIASSISLASSKEVAVGQSPSQFQNLFSRRAFPSLDHHVQELVSAMPSLISTSPWILQALRRSSTQKNLVHKTLSCSDPLHHVDRQHGQANQPSTCSTALLQPSSNWIHVSNVL